MSQPTATPAPVQVGTVLQPHDYAQLGALMGRVGFGRDEITSFMANFEVLAAQMARDLVIAATADLLQLVGDVHHDTAMNIYDALAQRSAAGMLRMHDECARIALAESQAAPRRRRR